MYLQLGTYKFQGIKLPQSWSQGYEMGYEEIGIIGNKPVVQRTGEKLDTINLTALFTTDFCIPEDEINSLKDIKVSGEVLQVVDGEGKNYGKFVLTNVGVEILTTLDTGYITSANVSISLLEYNTNETIEQNDGIALTSANPVQEDAATQEDNITLSIQRDLRTAELNSIKATEELNNSSVSYSKISNLMDSISSSYQSANDKIDNTKKTVQRASDLKNNINTAIQAASIVKSAAQIESLDDALNANTQLESAVNLVSVSNAPVVAMIGSREGGNE